MSIWIEISLTTLIYQKSFSNRSDMKIGLLQRSDMYVVEISQQFAVQRRRVKSARGNDIAKIALFFFVEVQQIRSKGVVEQLI